VKNDFVERFVAGETVEWDAKQGLKSILQKIVHSRYEFYSKHPEVIRMIGWQKLETKSGKLAAGNIFSPDNWRNAFIEFQKQGEIRPNVDIDFMILFISSVITGAFTEDYQKKLHDPESSQAYLKLIIESCLRSFES
jgi:hypothetical protein